jgi:hypothetical protein
MVDEILAGLCTSYTILVLQFILVNLSGGGGVLQEIIMNILVYFNSAFKLVYFKVVTLNGDFRK